MDRDFMNQYQRAQERTQMVETDNLLRRQRHHTLYYLLRQVDIQRGHVAECGCFRGLSSYQISLYLQERRFQNKFYLFDSFQGLSEFTEADLEGQQVKDIQRRQKEFSCSLETVQRNLRDFTFVKCLQGWIPERFDDVRNEWFIFVHIDVDLYEPIRDSLQFFYERTLQGGIIAFDDYGCTYFPGAKKAVDEFMRDKSDFFLPLPSGSAFMIKG
jgi:hypothetical protein